MKIDSLMGTSDEIKYVRENLGLKAKDVFETVFEVNLRGAGFESWQGIAALTPSNLILSSAPGIFSTGLSRGIPFKDIVAFSPTENRASINFLIAGELKSVNLQFPDSGLASDWHRFFFMLQLRIGGIPQSDLEWPFDLILSIDETTAQKALKQMNEMPSRVRENQFYRNWTALCLMMTGKIREATANLLNHSKGIEREEKEKSVRTSGENEDEDLVRIRLLGESFLLSDFPEKAEYCFLSISDGQPRTLLKTLIGISLAKQNRWEDLCSMETGMRARSFFSKPGPASGNNLISLFGAADILSFSSYPGLQKAAQPSVFRILSAWGCLKAGDIAGAERNLGLAKKSGVADLNELVRVEAAIALCERNTEKSFHLLFLTGNRIFLPPLLELGLRSGKENELAALIKRFQPEDLPPQVLVSAIGVLTGAKEWSAAERFLEFLEQGKNGFETKGSFFGHLDKLKLKLWQCEIMLNSGKTRNLRNEFEALQNGLSIDSAHPGMEVLPVFLDAGFSEIKAKAQLIGAELDIGSGSADSALTRLASCEKFLARKGKKEASERANRLLEKAHEILSHDKGFGDSGPRTSVENDSGKCGMVRNLESLSALIKRQPLLSGFSGEVGEIRRAAEDPLLAVVLGEFKAGKSTLLNAWLGSDLLPTGVRPTTSLPCLLRHGSKPSARIVYASGRDETVLPENLRRYVDEFGSKSAQKTEPQEKDGRKKAQNMGTQEKYGRDREQDGGNEGRRDISHVEIFLTIPQLSEVWFVDTPGLNSQFSAHNRYTETFAARGDAFIWVLDATQLGRESEFSAFRRMVPPGKKVISVLNRIDEVNPEEIPDLVSEASRLMGISKEDVIPVSARDALRSKMDLGFAVSGVNKFQDFSRLLNIELFEHAWPVKASSLKQRINGLFHEILSAREKETRELDVLQDGLRNSREILTQRFADWASISFPSLVEKAFSEITEKMRVMATFARDAHVFPNQTENPDDKLFQKALSEESGKILNSFREWFFALSNEIFPFWRKTRAKISSAELFVNSGVIEGAIISRVNLLPDLFQFSLAGNADNGKTQNSSETGNRNYRYFLEAIFSNWKNNFMAEVGEVELLLNQGNYYFEDRLAEHSAYLRFSAYDPVIRMKKLFQ